MMFPLEALFLIMILMLVLWALSLWLEDCSIVDIFWAPGFAVVIWFVALQRLPIRGAQTLALLLLVTAWALRLGTHLFIRWLAHDGEDRRYAAMRSNHGSRWWWWSLLQVFFLQGVLICIISLPLQMTVVAAPAAPTLLFYGGVVLAAFGILIEAIADHQLTSFRRDPANTDKVMDRALWRWSRHPNYFGDFTMWWGFYLIALSASLDLWWTIFSPLIMSVLLLRVSGVSLLEQTIAQRRPKYEDYVRRTSVFVPLPPRDA